MRRSFYITLVLSFCITIGFGQITIRDIHESIVKINDTLYFSKYEVTNKDYSDFIEALRKAKDTLGLEIALMDTLQWKAPGSNNAPYVTYYHKHPAYFKYPAVNMSWDAANLYCRYLTNYYSNNEDRRRKFKRVVFRLPTEKEWMIAAKGGDEDAQYPWKGSDLKSSKDRVRANYHYAQGDSMSIASYLKGNADILSPVRSYEPNAFGVYNMSGNVAEMVLDKKIIKGGSWKDEPEALKISSSKTYNGPAANVGFRYVMIVHNE
jgi:formylglycine-generating enzyme